MHARDKECIGPYPRDCSIEDGIEPNIQCGKKTKRPEMKPMATLSTLEAESKLTSSTVLRESSNVLNFRGSHSKRSLDECYDTKDSDIIRAGYTSAMNDARDWELKLSTIYDEEEELTILSMLGYLENTKRGFGCRNDEEMYQSDLKFDTTGRLLNEAYRGLKFSTECLNLQEKLLKRNRANQIAVFAEVLLIK
mmetsp:Transcript_24877/g.36695  ORF Transcript_24877/g.36695 Transcript_24877/m.36695 type:complete len:194 (+) Transcript_24877:106-687(+)